MNKQTYSIVFLVVFLVAVVEATGRWSQTMPGGYTKINPKSHEAKRAGNFAILEIQDRYSNGDTSIVSPAPVGPLTFKKVILAAKQIVAGTNYWEIVLAKDTAGTPFYFQVVVFEPVGKIVYQLTSVQQLLG
eukprot:TRINITY_DN4678_c0_g1_i4.p2 TRINITY_DN4678_c0_g1~~TRINITY_DN4678_c0_g1_i4.p2  ORF type:complete len:132 (+),score=17.41 TRINITY_DN4678_c0_g1_i4:297-692(+)